jgi:small-conductance mechanosensitive channel
MKRITQKPWFGKKIVGYGPAPATWQGWIITLLLILTVILDFLHFRISITSIIIFIIAIIVFFVITILTGWKPGMNRKKRENPLITVIYLIIMIALIVLLDTMTYLKHDFIARLIVNISIVIVFMIVYLIFIRKL